jgi:S1-C subfamily serine protease/thioredoxin-related protein
MSESRFSCPSCGAVLRSAKPVPAGKAIKCPKCGKAFLAAAGPEPSDEPAPRPAAPARTRPSTPAAARPPGVRRAEAEASDDEEVPRPRRGRTTKAGRRSSRQGGSAWQNTILIRTIGGVAVAFMLVLIVMLVTKRGRQFVINTFASSVAEEASPGGLIPVAGNKAIAPPVGGANPSRPPVFAGPAQSLDQWLQDLESAKRQAEEQSKDVLIVFNGSDWCPYSRALEHNVFSQSGFQQAMQSKFVPVFVDFPLTIAARQKVQNAERNARLVRKYHVAGFPTLVLADARGRPYAIGGYEDRDAQGYFDYLLKLTSFRENRDHLFAAVDQAQGEPQLRAAEKAIDFLKQTGLLPWYELALEEWLTLARKFDPRNEQGCQEVFFEAHWIAQLVGLDPSQAGTLKDGLELLDQWEALCRFKDGDRAVRLRLLAGQVLAATGNLEAGLRCVDRAKSYQPKDKLLVGLLQHPVSALHVESGTGFAVGSDGYFLTNYHVIEGGEEGQVFARVPGVKDLVPVRVLAWDEPRDIALLRLQLPSGVHPPSLGVIGHREARRGESVAVWGYPLGDALGEGIKFTAVGINALPEAGNGHHLGLDGKINPGNSGSPVIDPCGNVIGMVSAKTRSDEKVDSTGLAIPATALDEFLRRHLRDYQEAAPKTKQTGWSDLDGQVSGSVVMILKTPDFLQIAAASLQAKEKKRSAMKRPEKP